MKIISDIFRSDIRAITKYIFVIVIVLAIGTLPSLYAWINIYANEDPYAETGSLEIALASRDNGVDLKNGEHVDRAEEVIADVRDAEDIAYRPLDDPQEAIEGVRSGRFYAAIIFEDGFSYDMTHFEEAIGQRKPRITYYTNIKKNAVASKITDEVAASLLADINSDYLKTMLDRYFGDADMALDDLDTEEAAEASLEQLIGARDAIHDYNAALVGVRAAGDDASKGLQTARKKLDQSKNKGNADVKAAKKELKEAEKAIRSVSETIDSRTKDLSQAIEDLKKKLNDLKSPVDAEKKAQLVEDAMEHADRVLTILQDLRGMLPKDPRTIAARAAADTMDGMISDTEHIKKLLQGDPSAPDIASDAATLQKLLDNNLSPTLDLMLSDVEKALKRSQPVLESAGSVLDDAGPVIDSAGATVSSLDSTLGGAQSTLMSLEMKLDDVIAKVQDAQDSDKAEVLGEALMGDPDKYSTFFTNLVEVDSEQFYAPVSYGAAMTPFYSIIALWVGGVMLVTLMNCTVDRKKYPQITEAQGFFGRYLIFFLIGQIQAVVIVAGDIFLLGSCPVHPWLMWLSAAIASMVFVALIYALTLAFGDLGRAAAVVIMMVQIAGSSGSYPIEILPDIFEKTFVFFPFPYAINAMREAVCGMYRFDYLIYLAQLMVFFAGAVAIGVFIRKPFSGVKQFMYDKMKETEVM